MHSAGFEKLGLDYTYLAFEPKNLKKAVKVLRESGIRGFNVTMPFKEEIMRYIDRVDATAKKIGAVNTVVNMKGRLVGYNTDGAGAVNALRKRTKLREKKVLLIGYGGAAKAIAFALRKEGARVFISGRNRAKAKKLAKKTGSRAPGEREMERQKFDVLINATPVGMKPQARKMPAKTGFLRKGMVVFDIVYSPPQTKLLKEAKKRKCRTIMGKEMLLEQGFAAFRLFTGRKAPEKEMRRALEAALE